MQLEIYYNSTLLKTTLKSQITIKEIIQNAKSKLNTQKKFIEMNILHSSEDYEINTNTNKNNNYFKEEEKLDEENKIEFERCFDCNYFWINNIIRDEQRIINFIKSHTKFKDDNIENLNLNTVYDFFSQENKEIFDTKEKKLKFRIQNFGIDNYVRYKNLNPNFKIEVTYLLE